jgi:membrane protein DedA with SNARE-associated domain
VAAAVVWSGIYTAVSYRAASTIKRLSGVLDLALGLLAVAIVLVVFLLVRQQVSKLGDKAEAAYPGALL